MDHARAAEFQPAVAPADRDFDARFDEREEVGAEADLDIAEQQADEVRRTCL